ncbi:MAG: acyl carrier protein [Candidatus Velthaea sp.]
MPHDERLAQLMSEIFKLPAASLSDDLDMQNTGTWDSLSHMELIAAIEDEFHIELTTDEIVEMTSVGKIKTLVSAKVAAP